MVSLWLHNIRSAYNVGAILRTAEGCGVRDVFISGYTPYPQLVHDSRLPHLAARAERAINKSSLGAQQWLSIRQFDTSDEVLDAIGDKQIIAVEQSPGSLPLSAIRPAPDAVIVMGEEVDGVDPALLRRADIIAEIPMLGHKESFNVSVAVGMVLYHCMLQEAPA